MSLWRQLTIAVFLFTEIFFALRIDEDDHGKHILHGAKKGSHARSKKDMPEIQARLAPDPASQLDQLTQSLEDDVRTSDEEDKKTSASLGEDLPELEVSNPKEAAAAPTRTRSSQPAVAGLSQATAVHDASGIRDAEERVKEARAAASKAKQAAQQEGHRLADAMVEQTEKEAAAKVQALKEEEKEHVKNAVDEAKAEAKSEVAAIKEKADAALLKEKKKMDDLKSDAAKKQKQAQKALEKLKVDDKENVELEKAKAVKKVVASQEAEIEKFKKEAAKAKEDADKEVKKAQEVKEDAAKEMTKAKEEERKSNAAVKEATDSAATILREAHVQDKEKTAAKLKTQKDAFDKEKETLKEQVNALKMDKVAAQTEIKALRSQEAAEIKALKIEAGGSERTKELEVKSHQAAADEMQKVEAEVQALKTVVVAMHNEQLHDEQAFKSTAALIEEHDKQALKAAVDTMDEKAAEEAKSNKAAKRLLTADAAEGAAQAAARAKAKAAKAKAQAAAEAQAHADRKAAEAKAKAKKATEAASAKAKAEKKAAGALAGMQEAPAASKPEKKQPEEEDLRKNVLLAVPGDDNRDPDSDADEESFVDAAIAKDLMAAASSDKAPDSAPPAEKQAAVGAAREKNVAESGVQHFKVGLLEGAANAAVAAVAPLADAKTGTAAGAATVVRSDTAAKKAFAAAVAAGLEDLTPPKADAAAKLMKRGSADDDIFATVPTVAPLVVPP